MKLSKKGIDKALNIGADLMDYGRTRREFDQSDFEGVVVFTIEEALGIRKAMNPGPEDVKWRDLLERRIEQAQEEDEKVGLLPLSGFELLLIKNQLKQLDDESDGMLELLYKIDKLIKKLK